jgi:hypothetical protein
MLIGAVEPGCGAAITAYSSAQPVLRGGKAGL